MKELVIGIFQFSSMMVAKKNHRISSRFVREYGRGIFDWRRSFVLGFNCQKFLHFDIKVSFIKVSEKWALKSRKEKRVEKGWMAGSKVNTKEFKNHGIHFLSLGNGRVSTVQPLSKWYDTKKEPPCWYELVDLVSEELLRLHAKQ